MIFPFDENLLKYKSQSHKHFRNDIRVRDRMKEFLQKQKVLNVRWSFSAETRKKQRGQKAQKLKERLDFLQKQPLSVKNYRPLSAEITPFCRNPPFQHFLVSAEIAEPLSGAFSTPIFCRKSTISVRLEG